MLNEVMKMKKTTLISIIIPNYNGQNYLKGCLDSLCKQSFREFEIIIVDNASEDGSCEFISENYPDIKLISLTENYGFSRAVNEGIKDSNSNYVVLLNNDVEADVHWLKNLLSCIDKDKNIFSCSSKMINYHNRDLIDDVGDNFNILGWAYKRGEGKSISKFNNESNVFSSCAGAAIYRRKVFDEIGYFDEKFFAYLEDIDISYRAKIHGYRNRYCSDAIIYHVGSATTGSKYNKIKAKLVSRNNIYLIYKNMPIIQILINLPTIFIGIIIKTLFYYKRDLGKEYMYGVIEAFSNLNKVSKNKFKFKYAKNYVEIEVEMIINTFKYIIEKI